MSISEICKFKDCTKGGVLDKRTGHIQLRNGYCASHHYRYIKYGDPSFNKQRKFCTIQGCNSKHLAKGYCTKHYNRLLNHGNPNTVLVKNYGGETSHPLYRTFCNMRNRCFNDKSKDYKYYGGRGITVCDRWLEQGRGFKNFVKDMGEKPSKLHSLDRIDNDSNYAPENCRWATKSEQTGNRRLSRLNKSGVAGVYLVTKTNKWASTITINKKRILLGYYKKYESAVRARLKAEQATLS